MEKYISYRESDAGELRYYILQKEFPHFIGEISTKPEKRLVGATAVPGYNLWIVFGWCLRGQSLPSYKDVSEMILTTMNDMASWYVAERIAKDEKRYSKFKI